MDIGTRVRVKPPFAASFPGVYTVVAPPALEDGADPHPDGVVWLDGAAGAWSPEHLELAE